MMSPGGEDENGENAEVDAEGTAEEAEQLALADDEEALPWLESDEDWEEEGNDYRILIFAVVAVVALAAILLGANYLFGNGNGDGDSVADGSTIAAPDEPYKSRPDDPGGIEVAGTGDVSFQVGEGQGSEGQLADDAPVPSIDIEQGEGEAVPAEAVGIQIGAFQTRAGAVSGWAELRGRFDALQGLDYRINEGTADSGTIYRLQAIAPSGDEADSVCRSIRNAGGDCQVRR